MIKYLNYGKLGGRSELEDLHQREHENLLDMCVGMHGSLYMLFLSRFLSYWSMQAFLPRF